MDTKIRGMVDKRYDSQDKTYVRTLAAQWAPTYVRHHYTNQSRQSLLSLEQRRRATLLEDCLADLRPDSILDLGCGTGYVTWRIGQLLPEARIVGLDFSKEMIHFAQANYRNRNFVQADIERLPIDADNFDFAYALGVLRWFRNPAKLLAEVCRILRPGGLFFFTYPNKGSGSRRVRQIAFYARHGHCPSDENYLLDFAGITNLMQQFKFEAVQRYFITYGQGAITLPWTSLVSLGLEKLLSHRALGQSLAMTTIWIAKRSEF